MPHEYDFEPSADAIQPRQEAFAWRRSEGKARKFSIGRRVAFTSRTGLSNYGATGDAAFAPEDFAETGFWAQFLHPTVQVEGQGRFVTLNTYDRAAFTFGFLQFAAHVPDGDFVRWFRRMLIEASDAANYFPDLAIEKGRIVRNTAAGKQELENAASTAALMAYLNPGDAAVDAAEFVNAARLTDWTRRDVTSAHLQVEIGVETFRKLVASAARTFGLDGKPDWQCQVVADIYHQGRGKHEFGADGKPTGRKSEAIRQRHIRDALAAADPLTALTDIGRRESVFNANRCDGLKRAIRAKVAAGVFGHRVYDKAQGEFVLPAMLPLRRASARVVALAAAAVEAAPPPPHLCVGTVTAQPPVPGRLEVVKMKEAPFAVSDGPRGGDRVLLYVPKAFKPDRPARILWFCHGDLGDPCTNLIRHGADAYKYQLPHQLEAGDGQTLLIAPRQVKHGPQLGEFKNQQKVADFLFVAEAQLERMAGLGQGALANQPLIMASYSSGVGQMNAVLNSNEISERLHGGLYLDSILGNTTRKNALAHMIRLSKAKWCVLYGSSAVAAASASISDAVPKSRLVDETKAFQAAPIKAGDIVLHKASLQHEGFVAHALAPFTLTAALARMI
jgi:hypothetical protein